MKKKLLAMLLTGVMALSLGACSQNSETEADSGSGNSAAEDTSGDSESEGSSSAGEEVELTVFAAASLTETLTEISELYAKEAPDVKLVFNFDSSGTLKTQIQRAQPVICSFPRDRNRWIRWTPPRILL